MSGNYVTETVLGDAQGIARAAQILSDGGLVAVPTETVYGLAARADSDEAVARIYKAKGRPSFNPLIVHVRDAAQARAFAQLDGAAAVLAEKEWPGPLTLVVPLTGPRTLAAAVTAGLPTVAVRVPSHPVMRKLLQTVAFPLAAPSANRSGFVSPTTAAHVLASLDRKIDLVLDGGPTADGVESTILGFRDDRHWVVLRPGPVSPQSLNDVYIDPHDPVVIEHGSKEIEAPGQLASHYAPGKPVRLNAMKVAPDDFFIGFGAISGDCTLSASGDVNEAAARLYACLHDGAASPKPRIAIAPVPEEGVGIAINDRLRRAATPSGR